MAEPRIVRVKVDGKPAYRAAASPTAKPFVYSPGDASSRAAAKASATRSARIIAGNRKRLGGKA